MDSSSSAPADNQSRPMPVRPVLKDLNAIEASGKSGSPLSGKSSNSIHLNASTAATAATTTTGTAPKVDHSGSLEHIVAGSSLLPDIVTNIKENHNDSLSDFANRFQKLAVQTPGRKVDGRLLAPPLTAAQQRSGSHTSSDDEAFVECDSFADESALLNGDTIYIGSHEDLNAILNDTELLDDTRLLTPAVSDDTLNDCGANATIDIANQTVDVEQLCDRRPDVAPVLNGTLNVDPLIGGGDETGTHTLVNDTATDSFGDSSLFRTFGDATVLLNTQPPQPVDDDAETARRLLFNVTTMTGGMPLDQTVVMDETAGQPDATINIEPEEWHGQCVALDQTAGVSGRCEGDDDLADFTIDVVNFDADDNRTDDIRQLDQTVDLGGAVANTTIDIRQLDQTVDLGGAVTNATIDIDTAPASDANQTVDIGPLDQTVDVAPQFDQTVDVAQPELDQTVDVAPKFEQTADVALNLDQTVDVTPSMGAPLAPCGYDMLSATIDLPPVAVVDPFYDASFETDRMMQSRSVGREGAFHYNPMLTNPFEATGVPVQFDTPFAESPPLPGQEQDHVFRPSLVRTNTWLEQQEQLTAVTPASVDEKAALAAKSDDYYDQFDVSMQELPGTLDVGASAQRAHVGEQTVTIDTAPEFLPATEDDEAMDFEDEEDLEVQQQPPPPKQLQQELSDDDDFGLPPVEEPPSFQPQQRLDNQLPAVEQYADVVLPMDEFRALAAQNNNEAATAEDAIDEQQFEGNNIILQSDDFDYLLSKGNATGPNLNGRNNNNNNTASSINTSTNSNNGSASANPIRNTHQVRESLLLRFDPLQQSRPTTATAVAGTATPASVARAPSNYQQLLGLIADDSEPPTSPANASMHESSAAAATATDAYCLSETLPLTNNDDQLPAPPTPRSPSEDDEEVFASASDEVIGEAPAGTTPPVSPILLAASTPASRVAGRAVATAAAAVAAAGVATEHARMSLGLIQDMKTADSDVKSSIVSSNNVLSNIERESIEAEIDSEKHQQLFSGLRQAPRMAELEYQLQTELLKSEDVEKKMREAEQREETFVRRISEKDKTIAKMNGVMEAYEKAIAELVAEKEHIIKTYEQKNAELKTDRDANFQHLTSLETTFSDLHAKYERSKQTTSQLKDLELKLTEDNTKYKELLGAQEQRYEMMKQHAISQLEIANNKLDVMTRTHHTDNAKLRLNLKREEISRTAMQDQLNQKCKENQELMKICDELISGQGS